LTNQLPAAPESAHDVRAIAIQRVVALGRQWLTDDPEQLLYHFERQAKQLLALQSELRESQAQLQECQAELQQIQEEQRRGSVVTPQIRTALRESKLESRGGKHHGKQAKELQ